MQITKLERQKKNARRVSVYVDGEFFTGASMEMILENGIEEGMEVTDAFLEQFKEKEELFQAKQSAFHLLSYKARTEKEIRDRLSKKGFGSVAIDHTVKYLKENRYLDDLTFARSYIRDRANLGKYGTVRIKRELLQKGIEKEVIEELLQEEINAETESETARQLAEKKLKSCKEDMPSVKYRKIIGVLLRKGYPYDIARKVTNDCLKMYDVEGEDTP